MQGVLVFLAAKSGFIKNSEAAADFQNFVLCVEMLAAAVGHLYAFPYKEYAGANIGGSGGLRGSLVHSLKFNDFYHDTGDEGARKYRSRTFVPTGQEMDAVRKNKHMYPGKLDDTRSSSVSTSNSGSHVITNQLQDQVDLEAIKSSLLKESDAASAGPYDFSVLGATDLSNYPAKVPAVDDSSKRSSTGETLWMLLHGYAAFGSEQQPSYPEWIRTKIKMSWRKSRSEPSKQLQQANPTPLETSIGVTPTHSMDCPMPPIR
ncbi:hypothetical protein BHE74_00058527 [Ensete ventricosum]|nr:hypothetical protein BHE74_00058527 [Ensete ventricosum]